MRRLLALPVSLCRPDVCVYVYFTSKLSAGRPSSGGIAPPSERKGKGTVFALMLPRQAVAMTSRKARFDTQHLCQQLARNCCRVRRPAGRTLCMASGPTERTASAWHCQQSSVYPHEQDAIRHYQPADAMAFTNRQFVWVVLEGGSTNCLVHWMISAQTGSDQTPIPFVVQEERGHML